MVRFFNKSAFALVLVLASPVFGATFFFPDIKPSYSTIDPPRWLRDGHGNDGYVSVTSEVVPASTCIPLSNHGFWGGEKTQLVLSITTSGFVTESGNKEIPIATFDGRDDGSECASLSTLPINVIPLTLLKSFSSFNPGKLFLVLNVKSANDSNKDFIGSAKLLLGAAAMVVTGGAATAIDGITAAVGNPVLSEAQSRTNSLMKSMVNEKTPIALTWPRLRTGIRMIEIPVYRAEGNIAAKSDRNISQLQLDDKLKKTLLFTVRLSFNYMNTLFDPASNGADGLPASDNISSSNVLNSKVMNSPFNFLQILNDSSPSLQQMLAVAQDRDLTNACSIGFNKLGKLGLSNVDTAIVMKSFIDEARGGDAWYSNLAFVKHCFSQAPSVQTYLARIYGESAPKFVIGDVQDGAGKAYFDWKKRIGPVLSDFRQALLARENRENILADFNGKRDIKVGFSPGIDAWQSPSGLTPAPVNRVDYAGLGMLAKKDIRTIGCFIYKDAVNLSPDNPGAYFVIEDMGGNFWLGNARFLQTGPARIASLDISEFTPDWGRYFESYSYPGGDCAGILSRFNDRKSAAMASRNWITSPVH